MYHLAMFHDVVRTQLPAWCSGFLLIGGTGVILFFVLSAFSLSLTMPRHLAKPNPLGSFYLSRLFRIAPLFYFLMIATYIRDIFTFGVWHSFPTVLVNALFVYNFSLDNQTSFVWAGWAVGVEMVFYAVFPLLYSQLRDLNHRIAAFLAFCIVAILVPGWFDVGAYSIFHYVPVFLAGMIAFDLYARMQHHEMLPSVGLVFLFGGLLGLVAIVTMPNMSALMGKTVVLQGIFHAMIVVGLAARPTIILVNAVTAWLGNLSYSIYLLHPSFIYFMKPVYVQIYDLPLNDTMKFGLSLAITLAVVLPVSYLTYRFIELPGMALGRKLIKRQAERKSGTVAA